MRGLLCFTRRYISSLSIIGRNSPALSDDGILDGPPPPSRPVPPSRPDVNPAVIEETKPKEVGFFFMIYFCIMIKQIYAQNLFKHNQV